MTGGITKTGNTAETCGKTMTGSGKYDWWYDYDWKKNTAETCGKTMTGSGRYDWWYDYDWQCRI